ncbi:hypothetical protein N0K08_09500 [Acidovorax sp. Be4]|uniref:Uncharacterized protein n=1 Tax=Acidovorax bellezanensis TaxID=2976702 RepID=A0ABT2PK55_9BURK|nr:hypothetical protein [Acidovorax sp. Be4]MCT9810870.1 hypothetical protein [Acidovorax sp. Be4]
MLSILADLCIGIFEFMLDVLLLRGLRRKRDSRRRSLAEDAVEVARFEWLTLAPIALACTGLMLVLAFAAGVPVGWSVGMGITVGAIWGAWRYAQWVREQ